MNVVYYGDIPVGGICCRFESLASTSKEKPPTLVILTLGYVHPSSCLPRGQCLTERFSPQL